MISDDGTGVTPPTIYRADTDLQFQLDPIDTMAGKIQNIALNDPTWSKTYYTIGRKLGIDHTPGHKHKGQYTTAFPSGKYVQVFQAAVAETTGNPNYESANLTGVTNSDTADIWPAGFGSLTYYEGEGANAGNLILTNESKSFTNDSIPSQGATRTIPGHGAYTSAFSDSYNYQHYMKQHTGVFPPPVTIFGRSNYYNGDVNQTYPTNLSHIGEDFTDATLASHNHFSFDITMNIGGLRIPPNIAVNNVQSYTVNVSDIPDALNILMDNQTPSQTVIMIIRAY